MTVNASSNWETFCFVPEIHMSSQSHVLNKLVPLWKESSGVVEIENIYFWILFDVRIPKFLV